MQVPPAVNEDWYCRSCIAKKQELHHDKKKKKRKKKVKVSAQYKLPGSCIRSGIAIQTTTKVKKNSKLGVKNIKSKKLSKTEMKLQMKSLKEKSVPIKTKAGKTIMKVKTVKKKGKKLKDSAI